MSDETKKIETFEYFGHDFQQKVIWQLLVEPEFAKKTIPDISIEYFEDPYLKRLFIMMLEYYKEFDRVPNLQNKSIEEAIHKYKSPNNPVEGDILLGKIDQIKLWNERIINKNLLYDGDVVRANIINFIKQQEYRKVAEQIINDVRSGKIRKSDFNAKIENKFKKIATIGDEEDYGRDVVDNIDDVLSDDFRDTIPTGIEVIDQVTGNGLGKGEIGLVLAPSGIGKTTLLTKVANSGYNDGKKVLQVIFEDTEKQIQRKHYAIWSKIAQSEIPNNKEIVKEKVLEFTDKMSKLGAKLDIIRLSQEDTTINTIRAWIERQEKKFGYKYDMIVIDYLDCLEPNVKSVDLHAAELSIVKSFEALAGDYNIPCWSAIQTNRTGFNVDFVDAHNTGGNIKRIQKSHFVMSIAKPTKADNDNIANIKIIKARFARDGHEFKDCIFNNDTLEIRITDQIFNSGLKIKKIDEDDVDKINKKIESLNHGKLSEVIDTNDMKISDLNNTDNNFENNKVNEETNDKNDENVDNIISDNKNSDKDLDVEEWFKKIPLDEENEVSEYDVLLNEMRKEQGEILKE